MQEQLPKAAYAFNVKNGRTGKDVKIHDFSVDLERKLSQYPDDSFIQQQALSLYKEVSEFDAIIYMDALAKLDALPSSAHEAYYGRDTYWLYLARKAQQFLQPPANRRHISYAFANSQIIEDPEFDSYLAQHKISEQSRHIDVGCNGATVKTIIRRLAGQQGKEVTQKYLSDHIALLAAHDADDNPLTQEGWTEMGVEVREILESRSRHIKRPTHLLRRNGKLHTNTAFFIPSR